VWKNNLSLSNKQKKRINDAALMVSSLRKMTTDITDINAAYSKELDMVLYALINGKRSLKTIESNTEHEKKESNVSSTNILNNNEEVNDTANKKETPLINDNHEDAPVWAKDLYKNILKKCHPDKLDIANTSDFENKMKVGKDCLRYYNEKQFEYLIAVGGSVNIYTDKLNQSTQLAILNKIYSGDSETINNIQGSLSWKWGSSWDEVDGRAKFLLNYCKAKKIKPLPNKKQILRILEELEKD
jgi:hypothetical protein